MGCSRWRPEETEEGEDVLLLQRTQKTVRAIRPRSGIEKCVVLSILPILTTWYLTSGSIWWFDSLRVTTCTANSLEKNWISNIRSLFFVLRWNFSVGNFELKLLPEAQSAINFLEAEMAGGDPWRRATRQRIITEESKEQAANKKNHNLDLVIKVSVPDWKVMAFSTEPDGQLVWEHQVSRGTENVRLLRARIEAQLVAVKSRHPGTK